MKIPFRHKVSTIVITTAVAVAGCDETRVETVKLSQPSACAIALSSVEQSQSDTDRIARAKGLIKTSNNPAHLEQLGWAYINEARSRNDAGFYTLADNVALCMKERSIDAAASLLLRAHVKHQHHAFKEAESLARELVALRGYWFDYAVLGDALMEQGKLDQAIDAYQQMVDQKPGPQAYARIAHIRWLTGDVQGAVDIMRAAIRASSTRDVESAAWWRTRLAQYLWQLGKTDKAEARLEAAMNIFPRYAPAMLLKGRMLLAQNKLDKAIAVLQHAVSQTPLPEYQWTLFEALKLVGYTDSASTIQREMTQRATLEDPRTYALFLTTAGEQTDRGVELANALAKESLEQRQDPLTLDASAWAFRSAGRYEEADELMQRALAHGTEDARLFLHAGVIAMETNKPETANRWFEKTSRLAHMLSPSERELLDNQLAAVKPFIQTSPALTAM